MEIQKQIDLRSILIHLKSKIYYFVISIIVVSAIFLLINQKGASTFVSSKIYNFSPKEELIFREYNEILFNIQNNTYYGIEQKKQYKQFDVEYDNLYLFKNIIAYLDKNNILRELQKDSDKLINDNIINLIDNNVVFVLNEDTRSLTVTVKSENKDSISIIFKELDTIFQTQLNNYREFLTNKRIERVIEDLIDLSAVIDDLIVGIKNLQTQMAETAQLGSEKTNLDKDEEKNIQKFFISEYTIYDSRIFKYNEQLAKHSFLLDKAINLRSDVDEFLKNIKIFNETGTSYIQERIEDERYYYKLLFSNLLAISLIFLFLLIQLLFKKNNDRNS